MCTHTGEWRCSEGRVAGGLLCNNQSNVRPPHLHWTAMISRPPPPPLKTLQCSSSWIMMMVVVMESVPVCVYSRGVEKDGVQMNRSNSIYAQHWNERLTQLLHNKLPKATAVNTVTFQTSCRPPPASETNEEKK